MDNIIQVSDLFFKYNLKEQNYILKNIDFSVKQEETIVILGQSGCGKTTLFKNLIAIEQPVKGEIKILDKIIDKNNRKVLDSYYQNIGVLFQSSALLNSLSIFDNVALPLREKTEIDEDIIDIMVKLKLKWVGLEGSENLMPSELSGGMKKRAALARAMILDPAILYFDEPHSGLDPVITYEINQLIIRIKQAFKFTLVVITHDVNSALLLADRILLIKDGRILFYDKKEKFINCRDQHPYICKFLDLAKTKL